MMIFWLICATFVAIGLAFLLPTLWGFQRGAAWLWWGNIIQFLADGDPLLAEIAFNG